MIFDKLNRLKQPKILWLLAAIAITSKAITNYVVAHFDMKLLDGIWDPEKGRALVAAMDADQRMQHIWFTLTLDIVMPVAFGFLFIGMALKSFPTFGKYLALAPLVAMPLDYFEAVIQVLVLTGSADLLAIKAYTSPVKSIGYLTGLIVLGLGLLKWLFLALKNKSSNATAS